MRTEARLQRLEKRLPDEGFAVVFTREGMPDCERQAAIAEGEREAGGGKVLVVTERVVKPIGGSA